MLTKNYLRFELSYPALFKKSTFFVSFLFISIFLSLTPFNNRLYAHVISNSSSSVISNTNELSKTNLELYPNPNQGNLTIVSLERLQRIEIFNSLGQTVYIDSNLDTSEISLRLGQLNAGVYYALVNGEVLKKFIIAM